MPHATPLPRITRLAPSPTGALHLGNLRTFLITWAIARSWPPPARILMRIEDLDTPRIKPGSAEALLDNLAWMGIDWDGPPHIQSRDLGPYRDAIGDLAIRARAYPCPLTRAQVDSAASAPQEGAHEVVFPAALRPSHAGSPIDFDHSPCATTPANWRFLTPPDTICFDDACAGPQRIDPAATIGDFILWTKRGLPAYQLAVVVDDAAAGVTDVIRGDDLLNSAARQILLYRALNLAPLPRYTHLPLVIGPDGRRLAKRHGDTRADRYRALGVPPDAIVGLCAFWSGLTSRREPMPAADFVRDFALATLPRTPVIFTPEDERWLLSHARR